MSIHWLVTLLVRGSDWLFAQGIKRGLRLHSRRPPALESLLHIEGYSKRFCFLVFHTPLPPTASEANLTSLLGQFPATQSKVRVLLHNYFPVFLPINTKAISPSKYNDCISKVHYTGPKAGRLGEGNCLSCLKYKSHFQAAAEKESTVTPYIIVDHLIQPCQKHKGQVQEENVIKHYKQLLK